MSTTLTSRDYYSMFCVLLIPCSSNCSISWHVSQLLSLKFSIMELSRILIVVFRFSFSIMTIFHKELFFLSLIHGLICVSLQHEFLLFHNSDPRLLYSDINSRRYCIAYNRDSMFRFLGVVNEKNLKTLTFDACCTKRKNTQYN
jgi:hypothetical protein